MRKKDINNLTAQKYIHEKKLKINFRLPRIHFNPIKFIKILAKRGIFVDQQNSWKYFEKSEGDDNKGE